MKQVPRLLMWQQCTLLGNKHDHEAKQDRNNINFYKLESTKLT